MSPGTGSTARGASDKPTQPTGGSSVIPPGEPPGSVLGHIFIPSILRPTAHAGRSPALNSRGLRNNNPGNIRHGPAHWVGQSEAQTDSAFVQFDSLTYGVRALCKLLQAYQTKHGLHTIAELISRWAPPNENNTANYIKHVVSYFPPNYSGGAVVLMINKNDLRDMVDGIITMENGLSGSAVIMEPLYSAIEQGIRMALGQ